MESTEAKDTQEGLRVATESLRPGPTQSQQWRGDLGWALHQLREGKRVTREGWNGKGQFLGLQIPNAHSVNTLPYVYIITVDRKRVPWLCSQTDLLAWDWVVMPQ